MNVAIGRLATVAAALAVYGLARLIFNAVGLRAVGPEAVGLVNVALSFGILISLPASAGAAPVMSRFLPLLSAPDADPVEDRGRAPAGAERKRAATSSRGALARLRRRSLAMAGLGMLPLGLVFLLARGLALPPGATVTWLALLWALLYGAYSLVRAELFARDEPAKALRLELAGFALFLVALGGLAGARGAFWVPFTLYYVPAAGALVWRLWRERGLDEPLPVPLAEILRFGVYALLGSLASLGIGYASTLVASATTGLAGAGLWATLLSLTAPLLLAPRALNSAFLPKLSSLGRGPDLREFRRLSAVHQRLSSLLATAAVGPMILLAQPALSLALGGGGNARLLLTLKMMGLASFGIVRGEPLVTAAAALGRARLTAIAAFAAAGLGLCLWLVLLPGAGLPGVAAGYLGFALAVPVLVAAASPGPRGRAWGRGTRIFAADLVFGLVALASIGGLLERRPFAFVAAGLVLVALAHSWFRVRLELKAAPDVPIGMAGRPGAAIPTGDPA